MNEELSKIIARIDTLSAEYMIARLAMGDMASMDADTKCFNHLRMASQQLVWALEIKAAQDV